MGFFGFGGIESARLSASSRRCSALGSVSAGRDFVFGAFGMERESEIGFPQLCSYVGAIVVLWALAEQGLNGCISAMFEEYDGKTLEPRPPKALKNKIAFARKCLKTLPALSKHKEEGLKLIQRFSDHKQDRHELIHAALASLKSSDGAFTFINLEHDEHGRKISRVTVSAAEFPRIAADIERLGKDALAFGNRLLDDLSNV